MIINTRFLSSSSDLNPEADEDEKKLIKNKISILNGMLKKMIPIYHQQVGL